MRRRDPCYETLTEYALGQANMSDILMTLEDLLAAPQSLKRDETLYQAALKLFGIIGADGDKPLLEKVAAAFKAAAEGQNMAALIDYGRCLWNGWGVPKDRDAALAAYQMAGGLGSDFGAYTAAFNLYWNFNRYDEAYRWAVKAQSLGDDPDGDIAYLLGLMAHNGRGRPKNMNDAFRLHVQAAERGNADAQFEVSLFLLQGLAGETNIPEAIDYLFKAGKQDHPRACLNLGALHATGSYGLPMDDEQAYRWYIRSAEAGSGVAAGRLAVMSLLGQGTPIDKIAARSWIDRAQASGFDADALLKANNLQRP